MKNYKTIDPVVKDGLCTGCGSCLAICPQDAIEMVINNSKGIYVPQLDKERCNECGLCLKVCPGHAVDYKQLYSEIFGKQPEDILLGNYLGCYVGHAEDYDIRYNSTSGGLVTALLIFALEQGIIDGALVTRMSNDNSLEPQPFIARTREEIISSSKPKYCPVPANIALKDILEAEEGEKFAVVGLSCHIHGIRKAEAINKKLKERVVLHLGLFCNHPPSFLATEYILHESKRRKQDIKRLDYRGEGWPGKMKISLQGGEILFPFPDYWKRGFGIFFYPGRCRLCYDQGNELADISFGDPWGLESEYDNVGKTMLISRSEIGESFVREVAAKTDNEIKAISRNAVQGVGFRKTAKASRSLRKLLGKAVPLDNRVVLKPGLNAYLRGVSFYFQVFLGSRRSLWPALPRLALIATRLTSFARSLRRFI